MLACINYCYKGAHGTINNRTLLTDVSVLSDAILVALQAVRKASSFVP